MRGKLIIQIFDGINYYYHFNGIITTISRFSGEIYIYVYIYRPPILILCESQFVDRGTVASIKAFLVQGAFAAGGMGEGETDIDSLGNLRDGCRFSTRRLPARGFDCRTTTIERAP